MHLTDEQLNEYLDDAIHDRASVELHLSTCADCAARFSALQDLFAEIESLPDVELTRPIAVRFSRSPGLPAALPRSLTLTVVLQAVLAAVALIIAAPYVMDRLRPYAASVTAPSLTDLLVFLRSQWMLWLDMLSQLQLPSVPEVPAVEISSLVALAALSVAFLVWLVGNGLLLKNQIK